MDALHLRSDRSLFPLPVPGSHNPTFCLRDSKCSRALWASFGDFSHICYYTPPSFIHVAAWIIMSCMCVCIYVCVCSHTHVHTCMPWHMWRLKWTTCKGWFSPTMWPQSQDQSPVVSLEGHFIHWAILSTLFCFESWIIIYCTYYILFFCFCLCGHLSCYKLLNC